jgi:hypothetical protein|tara:strand:- start:427 stop:615 length:189 start_codon:yes stop_codon:yes gene_type:complete
MAGKKLKGIKTQHIQRQHDGRDVVPTRYISKSKGKGIMCAAYKDTRELVLDSKGNAVQWNQV